MEKFEKSNISENPQKKEEILPVPEGWKTDGALAQELKISNRTTERIGNRYRNTNPEYFVEYKDSKGRVWEYNSPEMVEIITEEAQKHEAAPEGWMTNTGLASNLAVGKVLPKKIADQYRESNPEYFVEYKDKVGKTTEHYSPELVKIISGEVQKYEIAPKDWKTTSSAMGDLKVAFSLIEKIADQYRESNPEYFRQFRDVMGKVREHYSPELFQIVADEVKKIPTAPDGWVPINSLVDSLGVDYNTLAKIADTYNESNPEYFFNYKTKTGSIAKHYSPELVKILTDINSKHGKAPEGWKTTGKISEEFDFHHRRVKKIVDPYRTSNPEYFQKFKETMGRTLEHYSPELIEIIKEELSKENDNILEAPENWQSVQDISERAGISKEEVEKMAKKIRQQHEGQFGKFKDKNK